jgi:hypothetical protein
MHRNAKLFCVFVKKYVRCFWVCTSTLIRGVVLKSLYMCISIRLNSFDVCREKDNFWQVKKNHTYLYGTSFDHYYLLLIWIYLDTKMCIDTFMLGSFDSHHLGLELKNLFMILTNTCLTITELVMEFISNSMVFHLMSNLNIYWVSCHFCGFSKIK